MNPNHYNFDLFKLFLASTTWHLIWILTKLNFEGLYLHDTFEFIKHILYFHFTKISFNFSTIQIAILTISLLKVTHLIAFSTTAFKITEYFRVLTSPSPALWNRLTAIANLLLVYSPLVEIKVQSPFQMLNYVALSWLKSDPRSGGGRFALGHGAPDWTGWAR